MTTVVEETFRSPTTVDEFGKRYMGSTSRGQSPLMSESRTT